MNLNELVQLLIAQKWMPLAVFVVGYLVRLTADDSKFPVTVPQQWHPVVALFVAQVYGVLLVWPHWQPAVQPALMVALAVLALKAYFYEREPRWLKWIARVMTPGEQVTKQVEGMPVEVSAVAVATDPHTADTLASPTPPFEQVVVDVTDTKKKDPS